MSVSAFGGCRGHDPTPTIIEKKCPNCGHLVELFSTDAEVRCENCGFLIYNDIQSCAQWCSSARLCLGTENYNKIMARLKAQEEREKTADPTSRLPASSG